MSPRRILAAYTVALSAAFAAGLNEQIRGRSLGAAEPMGCSRSVAGLRELVPLEIQGDAPLFVDAFTDADDRFAYVILLTRKYTRIDHGNRDMSNYTRLLDAEWSCEWGGSSSSATPTPRFLLQGGLAAGAKRSRVAGEVVLDDNFTAQAQARQREFPHGDVQEDQHHHSLVVKCPRKQGNVLSVVAKERGGQRQELYQRADISVCEEPLFPKPELNLAACTMVANGGLVASTIGAWVEHHLLVGFEHILVYVEEKDDTFLQTPLKKYLADGRVTLIPFFFTGISDKHQFTMQQAQEQHCLYQAKRSNVRWLGHMDVDEFFQPMRSGATIPDFLAGMQRNLFSAVHVRSAFWHKSSDVGGGELSAPTTDYPCQVTCKDPGYYKPNKRSKLIMNPEHVQYFSVHLLSAKTRPLYVAEPDTELRLNHFKARKKTEGPFECEFDERFRDSLACKQRGPLATRPSQGS